jgi:hypothetical protein
VLQFRLESSALGSGLPLVHEKPYEGYSHPVTVSSWLQPVSLMSMQQKPSTPPPWSLGSLQMPALSSGVVPVGQLMPKPPPEQSRVLSALQPGGTVAPLLPPLLPLGVEDDEQPSSLPAPAPPSAARPIQNIIPLTVFQKT